MSINIENNLKGGEKKVGCLGHIHYLPCDLEGEGDARVTQYFTPYIKKQDDGSLTASFRGFQLSGTAFPLPPGHSLTLVTEAKTPLGEEAHRNFKVKGQVSGDDITYWNWDTKPSQNDALIKALKWIPLANALHAPFNLEEPNAT